MFLLCYGTYPANNLLNYSALTANQQPLTNPKLQRTTYIHSISKIQTHEKQRNFLIE